MTVQSIYKELGLVTTCDLVSYLENAIDVDDCWNCIIDLINDYQSLNTPFGFEQSEKLQYLFVYNPDFTLGNPNLETIWFHFVNYINENYEYDDWNEFVSQYVTSTMIDVDNFFSE